MEQLMNPELETPAPAKARPAWPLVKWSEVLSIKNGKSQKDVVNDHGQYPIYGSGGIMGFADSFLCEENTVVLGRKGSINNPIFVETKFWNVDTAFGLAANKNQLEPKFLYYFCLSFNFEKLNTTVTIPSLTKANLLTVEMPLPPLAEQQRIVARLDLAQRLIDQRKAQLALMDQLVQSLFYEMFGDPVKNEMGWEAPALAESVQKIQIGPFGSLLHQEDYVEGGIPLINPMHIQGKRILVDSAYSITQEKLDTLSLYILRVNDIVMGRRGEMGRCAVVTEKEDGFLCGTGSLYVRPDLSKMIPLYLWNVLSSESMKKQLNDFSLGATMPNLNKGIMEKLCVPIPPLPLQQTFADRVQQIESLKQQMQASLAELEQGFQALMQEAFGV